MALQIDFQLPSGVPVSGAYARISDLSVFKDEGTGKVRVTYGVAIHASKELRDQKVPSTIPSVLSTRYKTDYDNTKELFAQGYAHLKTIYGGSKDV